MFRNLRTRGFATLVRNVLEEKVTAFPARTALTCRQQEVNWTYSQLLDHSAAVGSGLLEAGVKPGETVAVALADNAEHIALQLGAASAGVRLADAAVSSKGLTKESVKKILEEQKPRILIVSPDQLPAVYGAIPELEAISSTSSKPLKLEKFPFLKYVCHTGQGPLNGTYRFRDMLMYNPVIDRLGAVTVEDGPFLVSIDASTGSVTGEFSQKQVVEKSKEKSASLKLGTESRLLYKATKDQSLNLCFGSLACVLNAAHFVVPSERHDAEACKTAEEKDFCNVSIA